MSRTQAFRHISLWTPIAEDDLLLRSIRGTEELGRPFEYDLECVTERQDLGLGDVMGARVDIRLASHEGEHERVINGFVCETELAGTIGRLAVFRLKVVPFLHFLRLTADCRIFQDQSVPDIVTGILRQFGFTDFELKLARQYRTWEYCVQYRETYLNFITRLMEQEGIYFYFVHDQGKHTLVLGDGPGSHEPEAGAETLPFYPPGARAVSRPHVYHWRPRMRSTTRTYQTRDFDFEHPKEDLLAKATTDRQDPFGETYVYDYPGEYKTYEQGEAIVRVRAEDLEIGSESADAQTSSRLVCAGRRFTLALHPRADQNREYLIVGSTLEASTDAYDGGKVDTDGKFTFRCGFDCVPADKTFRRPCETPRPVIPGLQTAIVCGKEGQEVDADEHGRVRVKFHWDLTPEVNDKTTCWIRVSQDFAGKKWGSLFMPRRGQEVIVQFLEGDPDKPLITGRVYNGENKPPYDPKSQPTFSTIKTCTIDGEGFNEIRFDDKAGHEQIFIHAQKDMDIRVKETVRHTVEKEYHFTVQSNYYYKTGGDHHVEVGGSYYETINADRHIAVDGSEMKQIHGEKDLTVGGKLTESISGDQETTVSGDCWYLAPDWHVEADNNIDLFSHGDCHVVGDSKAKIKSGGSKIEVTPGGIKITTGGKVEINADGGIDLNAPTVKINAGITESNGVVRAQALVAVAGVVSPSYTPGAGNTV